MIQFRILQVAAICCAMFMAAACAKPEDPARAQLRTRLKQPAPLSNEELTRVLDEVSRGIEGKQVRIKQNGGTQELDGPTRDVVLGMLTGRSGVYDEGVRDTGGPVLRVFNAPGKPSNAELDAARRLFIDADTLLPSHFEFKSDVASDEFAFDLVVQ